MLTWSEVDYCFDNLDRLTQAMENSTSSGCATNLLATYQYDTLSRRLNLLYGNGASMAYSYSPAGDVLTLNHDMAGTGDDPHFTFTYSGAHQLASETNSDPDYAPLQPAGAGTDNYAAVNTLNQYPSITPQGAPGARSLGHDAKGNLIGGNIASVLPAHQCVQQLFRRRT
ncbi:MAG: hypothetical protein JO261_02935 [Alphaproteobacteria bacterium]|nr:hypothetical protein [Alphaproteobacteria bacterium]MBV9692635.1 hypothetical protein [Alphaproteobacteria bacterium]